MLQVRLIAVSKLKPATDILALHAPASSATNTPRQYDFGENYAQELTEKAALLPRTIRWHMIGALQTNKCKPLAESVPNLFCVASVDTTKKADALEKGRRAMLEREERERQDKQAGADATDDKSEDRRLRILVQVNTSGEESKSGVEPGTAAVELCKHVREQCPSLTLAGLMTIGAIARSRAVAEGQENEDFETLRATRELVVKELGLQGAEAELKLSMGMSADYEAAIAQQSDEVRVGTTIFGQRPPRSEAKVI